MEKKNSKQAEIVKWLLKVGIPYVMQKMDGRKTYIGAIGKTITGLALLVFGGICFLSGIFTDSNFMNFSVDQAIGIMTAGAYAISSGIEGIGKAHKIEKLMGK